MSTEDDVRCTALLFTRSEITNWLPAVQRLLATPDMGQVIIATDSPQDAAELFDEARVSIVELGSFSGQLRSASRQATSRSLLVMTSPVILPADGIGPALDVIDADPRVATVSFLSNSAGYLSFPDRNQPTPYPFEGHDETSLTRRLRTCDPAVRPTPISIPTGAATLVSTECIVLTGGPDRMFDREPELAMADLALKSARRGLRSLLDTTTYVARPWDLEPWRADPLIDPRADRELRQKHVAYPGLYNYERRNQSSPLSLALRTAKAKAQGLRILIDGSCLGPFETGTQVQTLALVEALLRRDDVQWVGVGVPNGVPRYAERVLTNPKARVFHAPDMQFEGADKADIIHRPFQPDRPLPWKRWRELASRVVVTVQDLIAYNVGAYHVTYDVWLAYRAALSDAVHRADGTVVITHDVASQMRLDRIPLESERLFVVENGTDHLRGDEPEAFPKELLARGWAARQFMVVLGADYSHKNRDLAIGVWNELRDRGHGIGLVLAGLSVAQGSSRVQESLRSRRGHPDLLTIPDVTSEERNWLLRHAAICLYPTSAEGFGLVPFEAARFGTPTVHAQFGPLAEILPDTPQAPSSWEPAALADFAERLLADPQLAAQHVESVLKSGERYTWDVTAEGLVTAYRDLISRPAR